MISALQDIWLGHCDGHYPQQQSDVGWTHLVQHELDTGDARPIRMCLCRLPLARQKAADKVLWEMQRAGLIEPSDCTWAEAVLMVPKKEGKLR